MEIKTINGDVIYKSDTADSIEDLVIEALQSGAYLGGVDLGGVDLRGVNLRGVDLSGANLGGVDLGGVDLRGVDLSGAYLGGAYLGGAKLYCANLRGAYLGGAYLGGVDLGGVNLYCANLSGAKNIPYVALACPSDGEFTAWKKVNNKLIQLLIPADAKRNSATTNKCRCNKAKVVAITNIDETETFDEVTNTNYVETTYKVGEMVYPDSFDDNRWDECSNGIHFFINKQDAINY